MFEQLVGYMVLKNVFYIDFELLTPVEIFHHSKHIFYHHKCLSELDCFPHIAYDLCYSIKFL